VSRITDLVLLSSPVAADLIEVVDVNNLTMASTGTNSKVPLSAIKTFVKAGPTFNSQIPANPTATAATAAVVMMGVGSTCTLTPGSSGQVSVEMDGYVATNTAAVQLTVGVRYGTGTAPINGAAVTGTRFGSNADIVTKAPGVGQFQYVGFTQILALTPATAYWFDFCLLTSVAADTAAVTSISYVAQEIS
jgi:hypothetical protein